VETLVDLTRPPATPEKCSLMTRLNEYVKTAEAAEYLGSRRTRSAHGLHPQNPVRRNPANGYRLFLRRDLDRFLVKLARSIKA